MDLRGDIRLAAQISSASSTEPNTPVKGKSPAKTKSRSRPESPKARERPRSLSLSLSRTFSRDKSDDPISQYHVALINRMSQVLKMKTISNSVRTQFYYMRGLHWIVLGKVNRGFADFLCILNYDGSGFPTAKVCNEPKYII